MWRKRLILGSAVALCLGMSVAASQAATTQTRVHVRTLPGCSESAPCHHFRKGRYRLGVGSVLPGLRLTLPRGWGSRENDQGELNLIPHGLPEASLFVWVDLVAVKSTGPGHGTTVLQNVGKTPAALVSWLTTNPDFLVVSPPRPTKIARRIHATTLTLGVSTSAEYGDPGCPYNPRCADFFTSDLWGTNSYGIGGDEEVQLSLASIKRHGHRHTLFVGLDAGTGTNDNALVTLRQAVRAVVSSFRLPKTVTPG